MPKIFFMVMTSSVTLQGGLKFGPLYSFINEIKTFYKKTKINKDIMIKLAVHMYHGAVSILI